MTKKVMNPKIRYLWMQWHAYLACFFLPLALLYAVTGALYLLDIKGGSEQVFEQKIELTDGWPSSQEAAEKMIMNAAPEIAQMILPEDYFSRGAGHSWFNFHQKTSLRFSKDKTHALLIVEEHGLWFQMVLIHKGHAGIIFWVLGILLGISLVFSLVSGVVLALNIPRFKKNSLITVGLGTVSVVVAFALS